MTVRTIHFGDALCDFCGAEKDRGASDWWWRYTVFWGPRPWNDMKLSGVACPRCNDRVSHSRAEFEGEVLKQRMLTRLKIT